MYADIWYAYVIKLILKIQLFVLLLPGGAYDVSSSDSRVCLLGIVIVCTVVQTGIAYSI